MSKENPSEVVVKPEPSRKTAREGWRDDDLMGLEYIRTSGIMSNVL